MADASPGFEQELYDELAGRYGSQWEARLTGKWGYDWKEPCSQDMERALGSGWKNESVDTRSAALVALLDSPEGAAKSTPESADAGLDGPGPSLSDKPWMQTLLEAESFEAWLTRIGIDISVLPSREGASGDTGDTTDAGLDGPGPSLSDKPWMQTLLEAESFEAWLTRIGIDISVLPPRS
jgi:hypothetical protein